MEFLNESGLEFTDISSELWREYRFADGAFLRFEGPQFLHVSESGGHRLLDKDGVSHYVPRGWIHLMWRARPGRPHFVK